MTKKSDLYGWLLNLLGDGRQVTCVTCPAVLTRETMTLDRYPITGRCGGKYERGNVRPQCRPCNNGHVGEPGYEEMVAQNRERSQALKQIFEDSARNGLYVRYFHGPERDGRYRCKRCVLELGECFRALADDAHQVRLLAHNSFRPLGVGPAGNHGGGEQSWL